MRNPRLFTVSLLAWLLTGFSACTPDKIVESDDDRYQRAGFDKSNLKVYLHPLLAVNGLHAHDKMAGEDAPIDGDGYTFENLMALANSDGEIEDCSWRIFFGANGSGFICNDETMILQGLLELEGIRQIWMDHTRDGLQLEAYSAAAPEPLRE